VQREYKLTLALVKLFIEEGRVKSIQKIEQMSVKDFFIF
jgi:hypothetical protein